MKLEQIGTSTLGKPIFAIKMTRERAHDAGRHARRDPVLLRQPRARVDRRRDGSSSAGLVRRPQERPEIRELIKTRELWFLPIQNPDGYDFTFTCGLGTAAGDVRLPRPHAPTTTASGARRCVTTTTTASTATTATASTRTATTRPSAASTRKAPPTASPTRPTAARTRCRSPRTSPSTASSVASSSRANINYHSAGQLLLTPVSYTTDYYPPDSTLFDAITGTDGDEAVFPYRSQHSSDLYESNGDTIDNAYMNYGIIGWTPEMDTCATLGEPSGCNQFASPDDEEIVQAVFNKNLAFALNVTKSLPNMGRPKNFENDPSQLPGQGHPGHPGQPLRRVLRHARSSSRPRSARSSARRSSRPTSSAGPATATRHRPHGGRARRASATTRSRATTSSVAARRSRPRIGNRDAAGRRHRQRRRQGRRSPAGVPLPHRGQARRRDQEARARRRRRGLHRHLAERDPRLRHAAPRYLAQHVSALEAAGYEVEVYNIDAPPVNGGSPNAYVQPAIKYPTYLGVLSHFDAVNWYSGDDFAPQDLDQHQPAPPDVGHGADRLARDVALGAQADARDARLRQRGRQAPRRRPQHPPGVHVQRARRCRATGPYTWTPDKLFGFFYPPNNGGDDDLPGHRVAAFAHDLQRHVAELPRRRRPSVAAPASPARSSTPPRSPRRRARSSRAWSPSRSTPRPATTRTRTRTARRSRWPSRRCACATGPASPSSEPLRQETVQADYTTTPAQSTNGGAIISTRDAVTFGFGLEQVDRDDAQRARQAHHEHLLPATADTTAPTVVGWKYPTQNWQATPADPVDIELTAFDERGDMKEVRLYANGDAATRPSRSTRSSSATPRRPRPSAPRSR